MEERERLNKRPPSDVRGKRIWTKVRIFVEEKQKRRREGKESKT